MQIVLLATYEMGRQPFGLASPAAWLREAGHDVAVFDLSRQKLDPAAVARARLVACYVPMHTATRLLPPVAARVREQNRAAHLCAYGLYAPLNESHLRALGFETILGPEFEGDLVALAAALASPDDAACAAAVAGSCTPAARRDGAGAGLARLDFRTPDRRGLPPPGRYATLRVDGGRRTVGYTEASRGCKHRCRHCPIVPVYDGRFRVVPVEVVMADVAQQAALGARHITFGDPDFLNGPRHALAVVDAFHERFAGLTYDVTVKVEHLLAHAALLDRLRETGCLFVTSAFESFDDDLLRRLEKGHTAADARRAVALCRHAGVTLAPTFVAFTPWTTWAGYARFLETLVELELVDAVASIQLAIRLLITARSRLLALPDVQALAGPFDAASLTHPWRHADPSLDVLHQSLVGAIGRRLDRPRRDVFRAVWALARDERPDLIAPFPPGEVAPRAEVPWLDEPWYC